MEPRLLVRAGIAASVIGHLMLAVSLILADARPYETVRQDIVAVDLVTPEEAPKPEPIKAVEPPPPEKPREPDLSSLLDKAKPSLQPPTPQPSSSAAAPTPPPKPAPQAAARPAAKAAPPPPPAPQPPPAAQQQAAVQPPAEPPPQQPPPPPQQSQPITAPEPDITVKYGVMLGLPEALPGESPGGDRLGGGGPARDAAKIAVSDSEKFRQHLRTCSVLPAAVAPTDKVRIVLRVLFAPDGTLAAPPGLVEASASAKGPALMQAAIQALQSCQPYAMLPADKYKEWKTLDLSFTPQDFAPG